MRHNPDDAEEDREVEGGIRLCESTRWQKGVAEEAMVVAEVVPEGDWFSHQRTRMRLLRPLRCSLP